MVSTPAEVPMRASTLLSPLLLLAACAEVDPEAPSAGSPDARPLTGGSADDDAGDGDPVAPLPAGNDVDVDELPEEYEYPGGSEGPAPFDLDQATDGLQGVVDQVRSWNAREVEDAYDAVMDDASNDCPEVVQIGTDAWWIARCTTTRGARFDGHAEVDAYADRTEGSIRWDGTSWYLAAVMEDEGGARFDAAGSARLQTGEGTDDGDAFRAWGSTMMGTLLYEAGDGWIAGDSTPNLALTVRHYTGLGARTLLINGEAAVEDPYLTAVTFTELHISKNLPRAACELEPEGSLHLRDPDGRWVELRFDTATGMDPDLCDGCGTVTEDGTVLGEICLDFSPLTAWTSAPW